MPISRNTLTIFVLLGTLLFFTTRDICDVSREHHEERFPSRMRGKRSVLSEQKNYTVDIVVNASNIETYEKILSSLNTTTSSIRLDNNTTIEQVSITTVCAPNESGVQCKCEEQFAWPYSICVKYGACDYISSGICKCIRAIPEKDLVCQPISVLSEQKNYTVDIVVNASNIETYEKILSSLNTTTSSIRLDNNTTIEQVSITTVCAPNESGVQCKCEEQFAWPYSICVKYGACDYISSGICKCIRAIPEKDLVCQPISELLAEANFNVVVELNVTDITVVDYFRELLNNGSYYPASSPTVNITHTETTTACFLNGTNYQCRCEDQYTWPYGNCILYGACDEFNNDTCGCINGIPPDEEYCQPNLAPLPVYEYQIIIELNTTDLTQLRNTLESVTLPLQLSSRINMSKVDITTVCSPVGSGFYCRCEDDYMWPCDKCATYGKCDGDVNSTCGCIKGIPKDGQYCQQNVSTCPLTTTAPSTVPPVLSEYLISVELNTFDTSAINTLRNISLPFSLSYNTKVSYINISTVCSPVSGGFQCRCEDQYRWSCDQCQTYGSCDNISENTCGCIHALPPDGQYCQSIHENNFTACPPSSSSSSSTSPLVLFEYKISVQLNTTEMSVMNTLRNISFPLSINDIIISDVNISTVCYSSGAVYQCRCEPQYGWPCQMCSTFGKCSEIFDTTCGCIGALPADGTFCQPLTDDLVCPSPPTVTTAAVTESSSTVTSPTTFVTISAPVAATVMTTTTSVTDMTTTEATTNTTAVTSVPVMTKPTAVITNTSATTSVPTTMNSTTATLVLDTTNTETTTTAPTTTAVIVTTTKTITPTAPSTTTANTIPTTTNVITTTTISPTTNTTTISKTSTVNTTTTNIPTVANIPTVPTTDSIPTTTVITTTTISPTTNTTTITTMPTTTTAIITPINATITNIHTVDDVTAAINIPTTTANITPTLTNATTTAVIPTTTTTLTSTFLPSTLFTTTTTIPITTSALTTTPIPPVTNATTTTVIPTTTTALTSAPFPSTLSTTTTTIPTTTSALTTTPIPPVTNATTTAVTPTTTTALQSTSLPSTLSTTTTTIPTTISVLTTKPIPPVTNATTTTVIPTTTTTLTSTSLPSTLSTTTTAIPTTTSALTTTTVSPVTSVTTITTIPTISNTTITSTTPTTTITTTTTTNPTKPATTASTIVTTTTTTSAPTTTPTTTTTSTAATTAPSPVIPAPAGIDMEMSLRLDMVFRSDYNNKLSSAYKELESRIVSVLREQYKNINGFLDVYVTGFREGSVITDFVVQTSKNVEAEMLEANKKLTTAMTSIAPVLGSVVAKYTSDDPISFPKLTYTGSTMTLTCVTTGFTTLKVSDAEWKFNGRVITGGRSKKTVSDKQSTLTVKDVIRADAGLYECTLLGSDFSLYQKGNVLDTHIKSAPVVRVQNKINIECKEKEKQPLECCVQAPYKVKWFDGSTPLETGPPNVQNCIKYEYQIPSCNAPKEKIFTCKAVEAEGFEATTKLTIFMESVVCKDDLYGTGRLGDQSSIMCDEGQEGKKTAECEETGWKLKEDTCIITRINELLIDSQDLAKEEVVEFVGNVSKVVKEEKSEISNSSATISAIVDIINTVANVSTNVSRDVMQNVLDTVDVIIGEDSKESWEFLNSNKTQNSSSELLGSLETLSNELNGTFTIQTQRIQLNRTTFNNSYIKELTSNVSINIPSTGLLNVFITTIVLSTLNNVMPARNSTFDPNLLNSTTNETISDNTINGVVVLVKVSKAIQNVSLSYNKRNASLSLYPQCVFWNFTYFNNLGTWDDEGCAFVSDINNTVTCNCNHLTSFSILMSTDIPSSVKAALDVITYIGVGISLASLVICLIIEGYVWRAITKNSTAFMRHVSIVNTALSLLIADICFIIGASIAKNPLENPEEDHNVPVNSCSTATFFMHFFYLALFFWMLVSGLLLLYRTVMVFSHMSKSTMLAIGFSVGYGCPLIIAIITVAATAPGDGYIRRDYACWLNWVETKALLALVIPALTIVLINILIVIVVLFKMLRRGAGNNAQPEERHTLVVIIRCVAILTPLFGLTWSLGVGTMVSSTDKGIHIAFAFFNSLQGFFILVFGTLFDSKIRSLLTKRASILSSGSNTTRSTSAGLSSLSGKKFLSRLRGRGKRNIFHVSPGATLINSSSSSSSSHSV